jgi:hypothetical protein
MHDMIRRGEGFRLPSTLGHFISVRGWEGVEYVVPETGQTAVAQFSDLAEWISASPARGGLGSRLDVVVKFITRPMDNEAAPECCQNLAQALPDTEKRALLPMITKAAKANAEATGDRRWLALLDEWDRAVQNPHGGNRRSEDFKLDNIQLEKPPTGTSAAAGLRKLRKYAESAEACIELGVDQSAVAEQYAACLRGETSVNRALITCGLRKPRKKGVWLGAPEPMARRLLEALGPDKAAELVACLTALLTGDV